MSLWNIPEASLFPPKMSFIPEMYFLVPTLDSAQVTLSKRFTVNLRIDMNPFYPISSLFYFLAFITIWSMVHLFVLGPFSPNPKHLYHIMNNTRIKYHGRDLRLSLTFSCHNPPTNTEPGICWWKNELKKQMNKIKGDG